MTVDGFAEGYVTGTGDRASPRVGSGRASPVSTGEARLVAMSELISNLESARLEELNIRFDEADGILWAHQRHQSRPSFTLSLLRDVNRFQEILRRSGPLIAPDAGGPLRYLVWAAETPGIFNLGGDLQLFVRLIRNQDRAGLERYARACIDICYANATNLDLPICTVALLQGDTLGGGFESAMSNDLLVAERSAKFGLPEILYGLLPGMGAYSFLARRLGPPQAEKLIKSGKVYTAEDMFELGIVDLVVEDGDGEDGLRHMVRKLSAHHPAHVGIYRMRRRYEGVTYEELLDIASTWVDTALQLRAADLRKMERLAAVQVRRFRRSQAEAADQEAERDVLSRTS